jgi:hypothetical protein
MSRHRLLLAELAVLGHRFSDLRLVDEKTHEAYTGRGGDARKEQLADPSGTCPKGLSLCTPVGFALVES